MLSLCLPQTLRADEPPADPIGLIKKGKKPGEGDKGQRAPTPPIFGYISQHGGVQVGIDKDEIVAYEAWDCEGEVLIASFSDEMTFVDFIFTFPDVYTIRLVAEDYYYEGEIQTSK